jgi:asparagine N-glycosylation enzyme membrane subunit Stt3
VLGYALRGALAGSRNLLLMFQGLGLSMPLVVGLSQLSPSSAAWLIPVELAVYFGAILIAVLAPPRYLETWHHPQFGQTLFGAGFILIGVAVGTVVARQGEVLGGIFFAAVFGLPGGLVLARALRKLRKTK